LEIHAFPAGELETVFRVLRTALNPVGPLDASERQFLETYSRITGWRWPPGSELLPIRANDVRIEGAHRRKRLVQLASIAALFNHPLRLASVLFVKTLASSLAVSIFFIQFAILQFHQGIHLTPVAKPEVGNFDPGNVLWAIHRGASCNVDMTHQWKYWSLMPLPLDEVREKCGLLPKLEAKREAA